MDYETFKTDTGYDITLPLVKVTDKATLLFQQVELLLDTWTGEFLYDSTQGIAYEDFLGDSVRLINLQREYYNKVSKLLYFADFKDFTSNVSKNRQITITFTVVAETGEEQSFSQEV